MKFTEKSIKIGLYCLLLIKLIIVCTFSLIYVLQNESDLLCYNTFIDNFPNLYVSYGILNDYYFVVAYLPHFYIIYYPIYQLIQLTSLPLIHFSLSVIFSLLVMQLFYKSFNSIYYYLIIPTIIFGFMNYIYANFEIMVFYVTIRYFIKYEQNKNTIWDTFLLAFC